MKDLVLAASDADGLGKLKQLRHLQLHEIGGVELAVLNFMPQLTHLHLQGFQKSAASDVAQLMQHLLMAVGGLQQLQHLHLAARLAEVQDAAGLTALVASTQLTYLNYDGPPWPHGARWCDLSLAEQLVAQHRMSSQN
jgi:hypothetical protein